MDRRRFLTGFVIALAPAATVYGAPEYKAGKVYRIGVLSRDLPPPGLLDRFRDRLRELGYVEGTNFAIQLRNAEGSNERLHLMAEELVRSRVDIIVTVNTPAAHAAKKATVTIPIVVTRVADPVKSGLVPSLSQPGGNITGVSFMPDGVIGKVLQLVKEALPGVARLAALWSADNAGSVIVVDALQTASGRLGVTLLRFPVDARDYSKAIQAALQERAEAVIVVDDARITMDRMLLVGLAAKHSLPVASLFPPLI
jgi:putative ABC transport system substrate-binding protein